MPPRERRNHYRLLYVQPEAPPEVIKAAYRALMTTLRGHPDLGGQAERAAAINAAYEVLSDPARRAAYDRTLGRPKGPTPPPPCPFCGHEMPRSIGRETRCVQCDSPLAPAPDPGRQAGPDGTERRRGERYARPQPIAVRLPGAADEIPARLRDLSFGGLSLWFDRRLPAGSVFRVRAPGFEALAEVAHCRGDPAAPVVHARLLTLQMTPGRHGVYLDARA